ncbi:MAG: hypothetical protein M1833_000863 [Piccolia ochrophora]|nr:MAG: hypothetical protein M1833_000863 [Piccolia ochrophora]
MPRTVDLEKMPAMATKPTCIFFTDFDGTITLMDSNDYLTDNLGFGEELRKQGNRDVLEGKSDFRESFQAMLDSIKTPFSQCITELCHNIKLDPHFKDFYHWALENNVPVVVLSSGMVPIIRSLLVHLIGPEAEKMQIVSNDVKDRPGMNRDEEGGWDIEFHDDSLLSGFGHDKSLTIRPYAQLPDDVRPTLLYAGDGVSDLSAARETDLLFAKKGRDLVEYCERESVPFTVFEDWRSIHATTKDIIEGRTSIKKIAAETAKEIRHDTEKVQVDQVTAK